MALTHAHPGQPVDVRPYGARIGAAQSIALFKSSGLEVMRLVFPAGHHMPMHQVTGEITIHCLEGSVNVQVGDAPAVLLPEGHLMYVPGGVPHALTAVQACSVLVTLAL